MSDRTIDGRPGRAFTPRQPELPTPARRNTAEGMRWRSYLSVSVTVSDNGSYAVWLTSMAPGDRQVKPVLLEASTAGASDLPSALVSRLSDAAAQVAEAVRQTGALPS